MTTRELKSRTDDLVVRYAPHERELRKSEQDVVRRWVAGWIAHCPNSVVAIGCDGGATRAGRVARLRRLRDTLVTCGVRAERVRYTGDPIGEPPDRPALGQPTVACLKVVSAHSLETAVRPIRTLFQPHASREMACSSAS